MNDILFRRDYNIGSGTSETDDFLYNCFLETAEYSDIMDFNQKHFILLGRTGSGKTALLNMLEKKIDIFIKIKPDVFALQYINNIPFVSAMKEEGINLEVFYKFLWLHEIISHIIKEVFIYKKKDFISTISSYLSSDGHSRLKQLKSYTDTYGNIFLEEKSAEKITRETEKKIESELGFQDFAKIKGTLSDRQKKEIQSCVSQYINTEQIKQLKNVIALLKEYFSKNTQQKIAVVIDDLDQNWIDDDSKYKLISSLLDTIKFFIDIPNLKILIAMRADLLNATNLATNRQNEKDTAFTLKLNWNKSMLKDLLDKRIEYLFKFKYSKKDTVKSNDIFSDQIENDNSLEYILNRTMMRPRDLITYVNYCILSADNTKHITPQNIISATEDFKYDRLTSLKSEWHQLYPNLEFYIKALSQIGNSFSYTDLLEKYDKISGILYEAENNIDSDIVCKSFLECSNKDCQSKAIKILLKAAFLIGIIGKKSKDTIIYSTPAHPELTELEFDDKLNFVIHPLFEK